MCNLFNNIPLDVLRFSVDLFLTDKEALVLWKLMKKTFIILRSRTYNSFYENYALGYKLTKFRLPLWLPGMIPCDTNDIDKLFNMVERNSSIIIQNAIIIMNLIRYSSTLQCIDLNIPFHKFTLYDCSTLFKSLQPFYPKSLTELILNTGNESDVFECFPYFPPQLQILHISKIPDAILLANNLKLLPNLHTLYVENAFVIAESNADFRSFLLIIPTTINTIILETLTVNFGFCKSTVICLPTQINTFKALHILCGFYPFADLFQLNIFCKQNQKVQCQSTCDLFVNLQIKNH